MFKQNLAFNIINETRDVNGRILVLDACIQGNRYVIGHIYVPNVDQPSFFVEACEMIEEYTEPNKILFGDFNMVLDPTVDRRGSTVNHDKSLEILTLYMQEKMMYDV